jgi:flagellar hook-associated protein 3 FlgL
MRITFETQFQTALADISRAAERFEKYQRQVSSGKRLQAPSDDPSAAAAAVADHDEIASLDSYTRATDTVTSRLSVVDTVLTDLVHKITAARTTAAAGRNSTLNSVQREGLAGGLEGIRDAIFSDFNTTFRGTYLFSGTEASTAPYFRNPNGTISAYQGNTDTNRLDIDRQTAVQVTFSGEAIAKGSDVDDLFAVMQSLIDNVRAGNAAGIDAGMQALDNAFERATQAQTDVGNNMRLIEEQRVRLSAFRRAGQVRLSAHEDANMVEAITNMTQAETAYQAALAARARIGQISLMDYLR